MTLQGHPRSSMSFESQYATSY